MALIKCPECGKDISDTCDQCIHCGFKLKKDFNQNKTTLLEDSHRNNNANYLTNDYEKKRNKPTAGEYAAVIFISTVGGILLFLGICFMGDNIGTGVGLLTVGIFFAILGIVIGGITDRKYKK